jgi:DNA invertase Pin-like site-specific DNA recombinase
MSKSLNFLACIITVIGLLPFIGRPKGVLGKSKLDGKKNEIQLFLNKGVSKSAIAKIMDVSRTTLRHFIKTRKLN